MFILMSNVIMFNLGVILVLLWSERNLNISANLFSHFYHFNLHIYIYNIQLSHLRACFCPFLLLFMWSAMLISILRNFCRGARRRGEDLGSFVTDSLSDELTGSIICLKYSCNKVITLYMYFLNIKKLVTLKTMKYLYSKTYIRLRNISKRTFNWIHFRSKMKHLVLSALCALKQ